ncbi:MAG: peptidoglycan DD-metalloendopeptidase family protein [Clostridia bacterium]|nr:peptidoglycan DD-metalloendopeptidase family protein [Clostridia bacterium]
MNRNNVKRIAAMICAGLIAFAFVVSMVMPIVNAAPSKEDVNNAKQNTQNAKNDVKAAEEKQKQAIAQYEAIDKQITDTEDEISIIEKQIEQTKLDLAAKEEELKAAQEEFDKYQELFLSRAGTMYENGNTAYIEILFGAENFSDFISKMEIISQVMEYDKDILNKLEEGRNAIENAKNEIEGILKRQEENAVSLKERQDNLTQVLAQKQALIDELKKDVEKYKAIYESAEKAEAEMIRQYNASLSYSANPVKYTGGKFTWPVPSSSRITSQYGYRIHPVYNTKKFHSGIDIGASYGVDIIAAADGTVTLATTNGGYGKCVVINHGSGITTLYAHNSSLLVSVGDKVTRGQVIAKAGSTGVSTGPHCHFEVRINGATTDPMAYFQ